MPSKRVSIPNHQRAALRTWIRSQYPRPTLAAAVEWYEKQYNHRLSRSTVSESLDEKFKFLDKPTRPIDDSIAQTPQGPQGPQNPQNPSNAGNAPNLDAPSRSRLPKFLEHPKQRIRAAEWPELEQTLILWHQALEEKGAVITGDLIKEKARVFWDRIPSLQNKHPPKFSNGWLEGFKARHRLHKFTFHGEAGSVSETAEEEMFAIINAARRYPEQDIFNMDETGLFWRMVPSTGLSTGKRGGLKKDKTRISLALCCNANGTERMPPLVIGTARTPHALRGVNVETMGARWSSNKKAWMTGPIMREWLEEFYTYVGSRSVLLLLDNFSAHDTGLEAAPPPPNVEVLFLPPNATSRFQPLDQGIIQNFKVYYKKQWLQYMVQTWEEEKDPLKEVNIRMALRWIIRAWDQDVSVQTIRNCYIRSTVLVPRANEITPALAVPDISREFREAQETGRIQDRMSLENFLNPPEESEYRQAPDPVDAALEQVLGESWDSWDSQGSQGPQGPYEDEDTGPPPPPPPSLGEALEYIEKLTVFIETRPNGTFADLRLLGRLERELWASYRDSLKQASLTQWFRPA